MKKIIKMFFRESFNISLRIFILIAGIVSLIILGTVWVIIGSPEEVEEENEIL